MTSTTIPDGTIMALEGDADDANLLRIMVRKAGFPHALQAFRTGDSLIRALTKIAQNSLNAVRPLLCFVDVKLPALNGHDVLRWIRKQPGLDRLAVVVLSASEHPGDIQEAMREGAQCYLAKYPQPRVLQDVLTDAQRFAQGTPAEECFRIPDNLLLVRCRRVDGRPTSILPAKRIPAQSGC